MGLLTRVVGWSASFVVRVILSCLVKKEDAVYTRWNNMQAPSSFCPFLVWFLCISSVWLTITFSGWAKLDDKHYWWSTPDSWLSSDALNLAAGLQGRMVTRRVLTAWLWIQNLPIFSLGCTFVNVFGIMGAIIHSIFDTHQGSQWVWVGPKPAEIQPRVVRVWSPYMQMCISYVYAGFRSYRNRYLTNNAF